MSSYSYSDDGELSAFSYEDPDQEIELDPSASKRLEKASTSQKTEHDRTERIAYGASSMQGWRLEMEDAHSAVLRFGPSSNPDACSFFAVFDGHGGSEVSKLCSKEIPARIRTALDARGIADPSVEECKEAIKVAYTSLDEELIKRGPEKPGSYPGSTAVCAIVTPTNIVVGNAGDSRILVCKGRETIALSRDHEVHLPEEKARIRKTKFDIEYSDGMVAGVMPHPNENGDDEVSMLNMSRAIGDVGFKMDRKHARHKQAVIADPEFKSIKRDDKISFMVCACDGVFEAMSNEETVDFVRNELESGKSAVDAARALLDACVAPSLDADGSQDNMTVIIVAFGPTAARAGKPRWLCC